MRADETKAYTAFVARVAPSSPYYSAYASRQNRADAALRATALDVKFLPRTIRGAGEPSQLQDLWAVVDAGNPDDEAPVYIATSESEARSQLSQLEALRAAVAEEIAL